MVHEVFADIPESRTWFEAIADIPDEEKNRIQIPDEDTWRHWLEYVEVPAEDIDNVIATTPGPDRDADLFDILQRGAAWLISDMGQIKSLPRFAPLADFNHPRYRYFYVQLLTACLPFAQQYHRSLGIPEEISQATFADLGRNVRVHRKREGVGGLGVMWWLMLHFRGLIYQLGRLQFEMHHANQNIATSMREHGIEATEQTNVLAIHIPDFMGPIDHDACSDSLEQSVEFFGTYFPDWPVRYGVCSSWLLDPQLKDILRPNSNIIQFQDRFTIAEGVSDSNEAIMQFVFGKHVKDIDSIDPQSSLERGIITHLKEGKSWHSRQGWLELAPRKR